jgi:hypothetical protein
MTGSILFAEPLTLFRVRNQCTSVCNQRAQIFRLESSNAINGEFCWLIIVKTIIEHNCVDVFGDCHIFCRFAAIRKETDRNDRSECIQFHKINIYQLYILRSLNSRLFAQMCIVEKIRIYILERFIIVDALVN